MTFSPSVQKLNILQQGAESFSWVAKWNDVVKTSASAAAYDLTAARVAMGIPAGQALFIVFSADGPFYADFNKTAVLPTTNTVDGSASEFSPRQRLVDKTVTSISLISSSAQNVTMSFYRP